MPTSVGKLQAIGDSIPETLDAHSLYERFGFRPIDPEQYIQMRPSEGSQAES